MEASRDENPVAGEIAGDEDCANGITRGHPMRDKCHMTMNGSLRMGWLGIAVVLALMLVAVGCSESPNTALQGKIVIRGSDTFGQLLGPNLIAAFQAKYPNITFDADGTSPGFELRALADGRCDIAAASRHISQEELQAARSHGVELEDYVIGFYAIAVIVNSNNPVGNLSPDQVRDIFSGRIGNWKTLGWHDHAIRLYERNTISAEHLDFWRVAVGNKSFAQPAGTATNYCQLEEAVAMDPDGIGYTSVGLPTGVKAVSIRGVLPHPFAVNEGDYPYTGALRLCTRKADACPAAREFIRFVLSSTGQQTVRKTGFAGRLDPRMSNSLGDLAP